MSKKVSAKTAARKAAKLERSLVLDHRARSDDSFQNFALNLGIGTDNPLTQSTYGFNPISRVRTELEWIHRGSWLGGVAIDLVAEDMTREGIELRSEMDPDDKELLEEAGEEFDVWGKLNEGIKWGRLYGGCIVVPLIDGQDPSTPLIPERIGKDSFRGLLVLDRWCIEPSLEELVTTPGPWLGLPKFYRVTSDAPGYRGQRIHYTRAFRFVGIQLPYWQAVMENLWGISILERLYDRMIAFDSASTGAAQLVYKSYLRTLKLPKLREAIAAGGDMLKGVVNQVNFMRRYQSIEGVTLIDGNDEFTLDQATSFSGISDALLQFAQQLAGALQIPLVRLFGMSPAGLNSTGESDLRTYYDGIKKQQQRQLRRAVKTIYMLMAYSLGVDISDGFSFRFKPLWQLDEKGKAEVAKAKTETIVEAVDVGLVDRPTALKELRAQSNETGVWASITDEQIKQAENEPPLPLGGNEETAGDAPKPTKEGDISKTGDAGMIRLIDVQGIPILIETPKGEVRRGGKGLRTWSVVMPVDYGYIEGTSSAEGAFEQMDCFIGPNRDSDLVCIIDQLNAQTGLFDEHKCMLGFDTPAQAIEAYKASYTDGLAEKRIGGVKELPMALFKDWLKRGDVRRPVSTTLARMAA